MTRRKRLLLNGVLVAASIMVGLMLAEGLSRLVLDPADYLSPVLIQDEVLGIRVEPGSGGHDAWGFRNLAVPEQVDIVAIGDSQTYGYAAKRSQSWPAHLSSVSDQSVYNLSQGGYGPLEYLYLLEQNAFALNPSRVVVGFYLGNDLQNAFTSAYLNEHWRAFRDERMVQILETNQIKLHTGLPESSTRSLRTWLGQHSMIYRLLSTSAIGSILRMQQAMHAENEANNLLTYNYAPNQVYVALDPHGEPELSPIRIQRLKEGLRISLKALTRMAMLCEERGVAFTVVLIPTKQNVFAPYVQNRDTLPDTEAFESLLTFEKAAHDQTRTYLDEHHITYVDVLPALRDAAAHTQIYPRNFESHPNGAGYKVIATAVLVPVMSSR